MYMLIRSMIICKLSYKHRVGKFPALIFSYLKKVRISNKKVEWWDNTQIGGPSIITHPREKKMNFRWKRQIFSMENEPQNLNDEVIESKKDTQDRGRRVHSVRIYWFNTLTNIQWTLAKSQA